MQYNDYSHPFQLVRRVVWAEEEAEKLAQDLADMQSTARNLLKHAQNMGLNEHIEQYRAFRYRDR